MATRASRQSELSCRYRQDLASVTSAGTICVTFEDLRRRHVEPFLEWLLLLVGFLTERPREVLDALRRLQGPRGGGMAVACVCRSWRAAAEAVPYAESSGLATGPGPRPLRPVLCLAPDGRAGFSTGTGLRPWPGDPSVWDWLEAVAWLYFVDLPLVYRKVSGDGDSRLPVGHLISQQRFPWTHLRRKRAQAEQAHLFERCTAWFRAEMPWGLEVSVAEHFARSWFPGALQVTVWWRGVYRVSRNAAPVELMLDLTSYRWSVVRGGDLRHTLGRAPRQWWSAYGN